MITSIQVPFPYNLSRNKQIFTFSGASYALDGYEYLVDIYELTGTTLLSRNSVPKYPNSVFGYFNASKIVSDYIPNDDLIELQVEPIPAPNSYFTYRIELGEKFLQWNYDDYFFAPSGRTIFSSTTLTTQHNFQVGDDVVINHDSDIYFPQFSGRFIVESIPDQYSIIINTPFDSGPSFGGSVRYYDNRFIEVPNITSLSAYTSYIGAQDENTYISYLPEDYVYQFSANTKFLSTNAPDDFGIDRQGHFLLYCPSLSGPLFVAAGYTFRTRDQYGNQLGVYRVNFSGVTDASYIGIGPADIASASGYTTVLSGQSPPIQDNVVEYDIFITNFTNAQLSQIKTFRILDECTKYGDFEVLFQDRLGSFGSFNFNLRRNQEIGIKRNHYNKATGIVDPSTGEYSDRYNDFGLKSMDVAANEEYVLRIELQDSDASEYFKDLLLSKTLYWVDPDNNLIPFIIKDGTYQIFDDTVDEIRYEIKIAFAKNTNTL